METKQLNVELIDEGISGSPEATAHLQSIIAEILKSNSSIRKDLDDLASAIHIQINHQSNSNISNQSLINNYGQARDIIQTTNNH